MWMLITQRQSFRVPTIFFKNNKLCPSVVRLRLWCVVIFYQSFTLCKCDKCGRLYLRAAERILDRSSVLSNMNMAKSPPVPTTHHSPESSCLHRDMPVTAFINVCIQGCGVLKVWSLWKYTKLMRIFYLFVLCSLNKLAWFYSLKVLNIYTICIDRSHPALTSSSPLQYSYPLCVPASCLPFI